MSLRKRKRRARYARRKAAHGRDGDVRGGKSVAAKKFPFAASCDIAFARWEKRSAFYREAFKIIINIKRIILMCCVSQLQKMFVARFKNTIRIYVNYDFYCFSEFGMIY